MRDRKQTVEIPDDLTAIRQLLHPAPGCTWSEGDVDELRAIVHRNLVKTTAVIDADEYFVLRGVLWAAENLQRWVREARARFRLPGPTYEFVLWIDGDVNADETLNALFEAGCDDATFGRSGEQCHGTFTRSGQTFRDAVTLAIDQVESVPELSVRYVFWGWDE